MYFTFFLYWGFLLNYHYAFVKKNEQNYYLDHKIVSQIIDKFSKNKKIYFDTNETNFYFFMANGLIKKNFYYQSNFPSQSFNGFVVKDNPILNKNRDSTFILENGINISINNKENNIEQQNLLVFSKKDTVLNMNDKNFKINKGLNYIPIQNNEDNYFSKVSETIYLIGLKIDNNQNLQWPWKKDVLMKIKLKEYYQIDIKNVISYYFRFPPFQSYIDEHKFDFKILPEFNDLCEEKQIIFDIGSTIIFENNCTSSNN